MRSGISLQEGQLLSRSLKVSRSTHLLMATVSGGVASNAALAMQLLGTPGQVAALAIVFVSLAAGTLAVSSDIYSRSSQAVSNLRSIGASSRSLGVAVFMSLIGYGVAGAAFGGAIGAILGLSFASGGDMLHALIAILAVVVTSSVAEAFGVYAGGRKAWPS